MFLSSSITTKTIAHWTSLLLLLHNVSLSREELSSAPQFQNGFSYGLQWSRELNQILDISFGWQLTAKHNISISLPDCSTLINNNLLSDTQQYLDPLLQPHPLSSVPASPIITYTTPPATLPSHPSTSHAMWTFTTNGQFSVVSLHHHINPTFTKNIPTFIIWSVSTPFKAKFIVWLALQRSSIHLINPHSL